MANLAREQLQNRDVHLASLIVQEMKEVAEHNYLRGERDGIRLFLSIPDLLIEQAEEELENVDEDEA